MEPLRPRDFDDVAAEQPSVLAAMWRYRWLVVLVVGLFVVLGLLFNAYRPAGYEGTAQIIVEDPRSSGLFQSSGFAVRQAQTPQRYVADQVEILKSAIVAERASELIADQIEGGLDADAFLTQSNIRSAGDSNLIEVSFLAETPEAAQAGANALVIAYQDVLKEQVQDTANSAINQVKALQEALDADIATIQGRINAIAADDPVLSERNGQFDAALQTLNNLRDQRDAAPAGSEQRELLQDRVEELLRDFTIWETIDRIEQRDAAYTALLAELNATIAERADLTGRESQISVDAELAGSGVVVFSPARFPESPTGAGPSRILAASIVLGLAVGAAIAYFLAIRSRVFTNRLAPEIVLSVPLLAEVPDFSLEGIKSPLPVKSAPTSASAEAFRFAAAAVDIRATAAGAKSLMVVSATLGSGKTTVAANTAIAAAREGLRVLAVDADFGNQELTGLLLGDAQPDVGITEVVEGQALLEQAVKHIIVTDDRSLVLLSRGRRPVEAATFFRSEASRQFFSEVRNQFDLVVIDGPPLLQVAYASTLVRYSDAVVVIVSHNSRVGELEEVSDRLQFIQTPAVGYIYTKAPLRPEMTASEGSMKDILGVGHGSSDGEAAALRRSARRRG